ncbi:ECF-type sigma factor, partial [Escherichia coli]|nr:ECF-type sigma factor [Escherichia coli]
LKRNVEKIPLDDAPNITIEIDKNLLALDEALDELAGFDPQQAKIVELRYFGGLTIEQTAAALSISPTTVKREWSIARKWLYSRIQF